MYLSSERKPMGREFLSEIARRKAKKIQRLRRDEREMREKARQDDSRKESRNSKTKTSTKTEKVIQFNIDLTIENKERR